MRRTSRFWIAGAIAVAVLTIGAAAALAAVPGIVAFDGSASAHNPQARPSEIVYTGDGSGLFAGRGHSIRHAGKIKWTSYGATKATATAANWLNNCQPDCAGGKFSSYPVTLTASHPEKVHGRDIFTHLVVDYTGKLARGVKHRKQTWTVVYTGAGYSWNFPPL